MAILNNEEIRRTFDYLSTLDNILQKELELVRGNKSHLDKIVPERLFKTHSQKLKTTQDFIDNLYKTSYDTSVVALVASFESIMITKYKTSFGTIKSLVGSEAQKPLDYFLMREKFVDGSKDSLGKIIELIREHIDVELIKTLDIIKEQRDYIAHGKRFGSPPAIELKLEKIALCLDSIILEIEK